MVSVSTAGNVSNALPFEKAVALAKVQILARQLTQNRRYADAFLVCHSL